MAESDTPGKSVVKIDQIEAECREVHRTLWQASRPLTKRELKYRIHLSDTEISNRLNRLREEGAVIRSRSPDDARVCVYEVSD